MASACDPRIALSHDAGILSLSQWTLVFQVCWIENLSLVCIQIKSSQQPGPARKLAKTAAHAISKREDGLSVSGHCMNNVYLRACHVKCWLLTANHEQCTPCTGQRTLLRSGLKQKCRRQAESQALAGAGHPDGQHFLDMTLTAGCHSL
jgi:hypothetical protein